MLLRNIRIFPILEMKPMTCTNTLCIEKRELAFLFCFVKYIFINYMNFGKLDITQKIYVHNVSR